jgi:hypothetical protein
MSSKRHRPRSISSITQGSTIRYRTLFPSRRVCTTPRSEEAVRYATPLQVVRRGCAEMTGSRARSHASLILALNAWLVKGAPSRPGKISEEPAKFTPPPRSRTPLTLSKNANHSSSEFDNSWVTGRSRNELPLTHLNRPTSRVFDLDPGEPVDIIDCGRVALHLKGRFRIYRKRGVGKG